MRKASSGKLIKEVAPHYRTALEVTDPCLWFPAAFCENLELSARICSFLRFPAPPSVYLYFLRRVGNPLAIYRGLSGPLGPKPRQSLKKVSPRVWKKSRKSLSGPFRDFFQTLRTFSPVNGQRVSNRCANTQPFLCNELGPFQAILGNFKSSQKKLLNRYAEKTKAYTTTTERKSFGELFWPQRKTFHAGGGYKNPIKIRRPYPPPKSFLCGPHFFLLRKVLHFIPQLSPRFCSL